MQTKTLVFGILGAAASIYADKKLAATDGPIESLRGDTNKTMRHVAIGGVGLGLAVKGSGPLKAMGAGAAIAQGATVVYDAVDQMQRRTG